MTSRGPLSGVRVLDLSRVLAGPFATQLLGDYGAEIIKIERPGAGDDTRGWGPPFSVSADGGERLSAYFQSANRNKKSVAVDIATPEGADLVREIARGCDVVVENFKVGGLARYGLDYAALSAINPKLVYCSITGFGQEGPLASRPGYDFMIQAMGGLMSITGAPDGAPGAEPMKVGVAVADLFTGLYATTAILAALQSARADGQGQHIDLSLLDCQMAMLANQGMNYLVSGVAPGRLGNAHPNIAPYQVFATSDGHAVVAVGNDDQFRRFAEVIGAPALGSDPRFASNALRVANRAALNEIVEPLVGAFARETLLTQLEKAGVPCGPIRTIDAVFSDAHCAARNMAPNSETGVFAAQKLIGNPVKFSKTPVRYETAPPRLGEATGEILARLGVDASRRKALAEKGVIGGDISDAGVTG